MTQNLPGSQEQEQETVDKANEGESYLREQDRFLPIANVSRIMKKAVPPIGKVKKSSDIYRIVNTCNRAVSTSIKLHYPWRKVISFAALLSV